MSKMTRAQLFKVRLSQVWGRRCHAILQEKSGLGQRMSPETIWRLPSDGVCFGLYHKQDACYTGITRDAMADSFIPTVCFADL